MDEREKEELRGPTKLKLILILLAAFTSSALLLHQINQTFWFDLIDSAAGREKKWNQINLFIHSKEWRLIDFTFLSLINHSFNQLIIQSTQSIENWWDWWMNVDWWAAFEWTSSGLWAGGPSAARQFHSAVILFLLHCMPLAPSSLLSFRQAAPLLHFQEEIKVD